MEALLVRIDHFHDRKLYVSTAKAWLEALGISHGRLVTMGDVHLLLIEATPTQNDALLERFATTPVDTNAKDEPCIDRFIDIVGRKPITTAVCKGFLEMNVLNAPLLEQLMVGDWHCEKQWLEDARSTPRTKALLQWKEDAKNARKDRRKRAAQDRDAERAAKKAKAEEEKARAEAAALAEGDQEEEDGKDEEGEEEETQKKDDVVVDAAVHTATPESIKKEVTTPQAHTPVPPAKKTQIPQATKRKHQHTQGTKNPQQASASRSGGGTKRKQKQKKARTSA